MAETPAIDNLISEMERLKRAEAILDRVFMEYDPYGRGKITDTTLHLMREHFHFDDSE